MVPDSTNPELIPAAARAHCDVFQSRLPLQGILIVKFYKVSIFVIAETQFAIQSQVT